MWPFDEIGDSLGGKIAELARTAFEGAMQMIWDGSLIVLRTAFGLADQFSVFVVDPHSGPVGVLWPIMLWISVALALGLFFWQLTMTSLRGGKGFVRLVAGPVQYGIALAVTTGLVGTFLVAADGLTQGILSRGLQSENFQEALTHTAFSDDASDGIKAAVLGICAIIGVLPAAIGYCLEMLFREAAIYMLVATIPITAAGLLANVTKSWFWKTARWLLACIAMKPVLALALVLGIAIVGGAQGLSGLLAGIGVLLISVFTPFVLFRLFAFVDPNTDAGGAFRDALSSSTGFDSYGSGNPAAQAASAITGIGGGGGGSGDASGSGGSAQEAAASGRFDDALADYAGEEMDTYGIGSSSGSSESSSDDSDSGSEQNLSDADNEADVGAAPPPAANHGSITSSDGIGPQGTGGDGSGGGEPPPPEPPGDEGGHEPPDNDGGPQGGGGSGPKPGGGGGAASSEAAEAAVIV